METDPDGRFFWVKSAREQDIDGPDELDGRATPRLKSSGAWTWRQRLVVVLNITADKKARSVTVERMKPIEVNPVFHIPIASPHFPSCEPVFSRNLELEDAWPECFVIKNWACVKFDKVFDLCPDQLKPLVRSTDGDGGDGGPGSPLRLHPESLAYLQWRMRRRQQLQEVQAAAATKHLDMSMLELGAPAAPPTAYAGPAGGSSGRQREDEARSVRSSKASVSMSSEGDTLVERDWWSSKWSLNSLLGTSRRTSIVSVASERPSTANDVELQPWKH